MSEKRFNGKVIYNPSGKAGEYSYWACNFYTGCSNNCDYCYCKKGVMSHVWSDKPQLKKCFRDENHAIEVFEKEFMQNVSELQVHGLFFSFTTDPMLPETISLTWDAMNICIDNNVPIKILSKRSDWIDRMIEPYCSDGVKDFSKRDKELITIGFTLTGHDELEPNASTNLERIKAMRKLHNAGFKTFASIEPIIQLESSLSMINQTIGFCDLYKIGLMSGRKYDWRELRGFMLACTPLEGKFYFKDSFINQASMDRDNLPKNCVGRDYNMFNV